MPRPRNTKGGPRVGRSDGTCGDDDPEVPFAIEKNAEGNYFSMRGSPKPHLVGDSVR